MARVSISHAGWPTFNIKHWWSEAQTSWKVDLIAGLTVWGLVIPESIAYTSLAGVKPVSGIWAIVLVLPFYVLFGGSKELVASPTAATAVTAGGLIVALHPKNPANTMGVIAICAGVIFLLAYFFKLGFVVNFISQPINAGFMFGLAVYLTVSQLPKLLGIKGGDGNALSRAWHIATNLGSVNGMTIALAALGLIIMFGLPKVAPKIPAGLLTLVVTTAIVGLGHFDTKYNVKVVGKIPTGFPSLIDPKGDLADLWQIFVGSIGIVLLAFSEASSVATELAEERGHDYDPSSDMFAFGVGNIASGAVGGLVGAGSMSSSATNVSAGARTPLSSGFVSLFALATALFAGGLLASLPEATLGVLIIHAISNHLRVAFYRRIDSYSIAEARIALVAAGGVILFDVLYGLLIAVAASLVWYLYRTTRVTTHEIGRSAEHPDVLVRADSPNCTPLGKGIVGLRFSGELFYGNVDDACDDVQSAFDAIPADDAEGGERTIVLDFEEQTFFDYTTVQRLHRLFTALDRADAQVILIGVRKSLEDSLLSEGPFPDGVQCLRSTAPSDAIGRAKAATADGAHDRDDE